MARYEQHPLAPYIPQQVRLLLLGSFPPAVERWSMPFFYPNFQNDMWRILGEVFYGDKAYFVSLERAKTFDLSRIKQMLDAKGIALYDVAQEVHRLKDNASDKFLEIVKPTNLLELLQQMPSCVAVASTGQKSAEEVAKQLQTDIPLMGKCVQCAVSGFEYINFYRMPSSSRAYPMRLEEKAAYYKQMMNKVLLPPND